MYIVRPITMETLWGDTRLHAYQGDRAAQTIGCVYTLSGIDGIEFSEGLERGVWLSLARAPGLGPGGRRFESCHPDDSKKITFVILTAVSQVDLRV